MVCIKDRKKPEFAQNSKQNFWRSLVGQIGKIWLFDFWENVQFLQFYQKFSIF
jgi:hypothetical protein